MFATANGQTGMNFNPSAASDGSNPVLGLWNAYNRIPVSATNQDSTSTWTYSTGTWRHSNGQSANRVRYVDGLASSPVTARFNQSADGVAGTAALVGIERDWSSGAPTGATGVLSNGSSTVTIYGNGVAFNAWPPSLGQHEINSLEYGGSAVTFFGTGLGTGQNMGLFVHLEM